MAMTESIVAGPVQALVCEHRCIEVLLDCLGRLAREARRCGRLDVLACGDVLAALDLFVEGAHHHKEERWLFPLIEKRGIPARLSRASLMLAEHASGQADLQVMRIALAAVGDGHARALDILLDHAEHYVRDLRGHIENEDRVLLPLADAVLREDDRRDLLEKFAALDADTNSRSAGLARSAEALAQRLGVPVGPGFRNARVVRPARVSTPAAPAAGPR